MPTRKELDMGAILTLIGSFLLQWVAGSQYALGNCTVYFASYFKMVKGESVTTMTFYPM